MKKIIMTIGTIAVLLVGMFFVSASLSGDVVAEEKIGDDVEVTCNKETCDGQCGGNCGIPTCGCRR